MKAFYVLRPSDWTHGHVRRAAQMGAIDTVLYDSDAPPEGIERKWLDGYDFGIETLKLYGKFGINVYPVIVWQDSMLSPDDPRNTVDARIAHALRIVEDSGVNGMVWDTEDYRVQRGEGFQQRVPQDFDDKCKAAGLNVIGGMPKKRNGVWFTEDTYEKNRWWKVRLEGLGDDIIPGAWVEMHADPAKYIRKLNKCYKSYWVYSHVLFGQRMINPLPDYISSDLLPLTWWETL